MLSVRDGRNNGRLNRRYSVPRSDSMTRLWSLPSSWPTTNGYTDPPGAWNPTEVADSVFLQSECAMIVGFKFRPPGYAETIKIQRTGSLIRSPFDND
jgi:hypothetical protein